MSITSRRRTPTAAALALSLLLALPLLATAGPAGAAAHAGAPSGAGRVQPVSAPVSNVLVILGHLLGGLLPPPAPALPGMAPDVVAQVAASTVRVSGVACGVTLHGTGFSPAHDVIVTNAHVVAGTTSVQVLRPDGRTLPASVQVFDHRRDLAVLSVPGLGQRSLALGSAVAGEVGAVLGHSRGRVPVEVSPAQVVRRVTADVGDIYNRAAPPRQILVLRSNLEPGDSGGPMVNRAGQVVGVAFGVANFRPSTAFAVASEELAPVLAQPRAGPVRTGPCLV